ncbi:hypothetical protein LBMAG42_24970 [Deltaproteobacteria bacterium]|nr:hypothetical protein LBMAG42_24970 [Deltaproteobacteria bacterium]
MPPRASSRFTVYLVPGVEDAASAEDVAREIAGFTAMIGGERGVIAERADPERFIANGQGGFRVRCPSRGETLVRPFATALESWRAGGRRALRCPCGQEHDLAALLFEPPAAFARQWLRVVEAGSLDVDATAAEVLDRRWPGWRAIGSRG